MKSFLYISLGVIVGAVVIFLWLYPQSFYSKKQSILLSERIESISKLMVVEGTFAEVYSYTDARKIFYELISFEKKAVLIVKANASVAYDLSKMDIQLNPKERLATIVYIPEPELIISPEINYFDLTESTFNEFTKDDLNKLNVAARNEMENHIIQSGFIMSADMRLEEIIENLRIYLESIGWKLENKSKKWQLIPVE